MNIAILSGKGGTGKTLLAVNLAAVAGNAVYIDCDVEEPNGHLFFKPQGFKTEAVAVKMPVVNDDRCTGCRICVDFCRFNALAYTADHLVIFDQICHSCGGCALLCPEDALREEDRIIGNIKEGLSGNVKIYSGMLNTGEASGIPIIKRLLSLSKKERPGLCLIDCPPGSACIVMETIREADYCVLVAEPTLFGVHNLNLVYELVSLFNKPFAVVLNKCLEGEENPAEKFCQEKGIKILGRIAFDPELGAINSKALVVARESKRYKAIFSSLLSSVLKEAQHEAVVNP
jgi:MinD superfamily P-loop ATPase